MRKLKGLGITIKGQITGTMKPKFRLEFNVYTFQRKVREREGKEQKEELI